MKFRIKRYFIWVFSVCQRNHLGVSGPQRIKYTMRGSRKLVKRGSNSDSFFLIYEGREDAITTKSGPLSGRQQNALEIVAQHGMLAW